MFYQDFWGRSRQNLIKNCCVAEYTINKDSKQIIDLENMFVLQMTDKGLKTVII